MRITRHLATLAVAALAVTSVVGSVVPSTVSAAPSAEPALQWLEGELTDNGGSLPSPFGGVDWGLTIDAIFALNAAGEGCRSRCHDCHEQSGGEHQRLHHR